MTNIGPPVATFRHHPIVITGAGLVTCLGTDRETTWQQVLLGRHGIVPLSALEQGDPVMHTGGQVPLQTESASEEHDSTAHRETRFLRVAIVSAMREARILDHLPWPMHRCAVVLGTTLHGMRRAGRFLRTGYHAVLAEFPAGAVLQRAAAGLGLGGPGITTCSACASGLSAIGLGITLLQAGMADVVVAGGYDPISEYAYAGFSSLRLVSDQPPRPFSKHRSGMKLAEGYAALVLERADDAAQRGISPLAWIAGAGESSDAHHLSQPHPEGAGAAAAMAAALAAAGLEPGDIGMVSAHGTATPDNDSAEYEALRRTFGEALPRIPVVAFKSHLGHTLGGAGAAELVLSLMALHSGLAPPCASVQPEECAFPDLHPTTETARPIDARHVLNTSLGFGGSNVCVVLSRTGGQPVLRSAQGLGSSAPALESAHTHTVPGDTKQRPVITGVGVLLPDLIGTSALLAQLAQPSCSPLTSDTGPVPEEAVAPLLEALGARRLRRVSDYVKYSLAATALAMKHAGIEDFLTFGAGCAAVLGTQHGSASYCERYYRQIAEEGLGAANALLFAEGVPNAAAAHLSMALGIRGGCQTLIGTRTAGLDALAMAAARIASGAWSRAVVSAAEEFSPLINAAYAHWGLHRSGGNGGFYSGGGAVALVLESAHAAAERGAVVRAWIDRAAAVSACGRVDGRFVKRAHRMMRQFHPEDVIISASQGTWLERLDRIVLRGRSVIAPLQNRGIAETFSVSPLLALAGAIGDPSRHDPDGVLHSVPHPPAAAHTGDARHPQGQVIAAAEFTGTWSAVRITAVGRD